MPVDEFTMELIRMWAKHRSEGSEVYNVGTEFLNMRRTRWEEIDNAYRVLVGTRLAEAAIMEWELNRELEVKR